MDVAALAARAGAAFCRGRVAGLDRAARPSRLDGRHARCPTTRSRWPWAARRRRCRAQRRCPDRVFPVKPIAGLWALRQALERRFAAGRAVRWSSPAAAITGCELAASVAGLAARRGGRARVTILAGEGRPLRRCRSRRRRGCWRACAARGVTVAAGRAHRRCGRTAWRPRPAPCPSTCWRSRPGSGPRRSSPRSGCRWRRTAGWWWTRISAPPPTRACTARGTASRSTGTRCRGRGSSPCGRRPCCGTTCWPRWRAAPRAASGRGGATSGS